MDTLAAGGLCFGIPLLCRLCRLRRFGIMSIEIEHPQGAEEALPPWQGCFFIGSLPMERRTQINAKMSEDELATIRLFCVYKDRTLSDTVCSCVLDEIGRSYQELKQEAGVDLFEIAKAKSA